MDDDALGSIHVLYQYVLRAKLCWTPYIGLNLAGADVGSTLYTISVYTLHHVVHLFQIILVDIVYK